MITHKIPTWLHGYSGNSAHYTWMNSPFLHHKTTEDEEWAMATDGKSCVGVKIPYEGPKASRDIFLDSPGDWVSKTVESFFITETSPLLNLTRLKKELETITNSCVTCDNTGQADCASCKATTEVGCPTCKGGGSKPCITCKKPDLCKTCDGLGVVECKVCDNGQAPCHCTVEKKKPAVQIDDGIYFNVKLLKDLLTYAPETGYINVDNNKITVYNSDWFGSLASVRPNTQISHPKIYLRHFETN